MNENEKMEKYLDFAKELKKLQNIKVTVIRIVVGGPWNSPQEPRKETLWDERKNFKLSTTKIE